MGSEVDGIFGPIFHQGRGRGAPTPGAMSSSIWDPLHLIAGKGKIICKPFVQGIEAVGKFGVLLSVVRLHYNSDFISHGRAAVKKMILISSQFFLKPFFLLVCSCNFYVPHFDLV